MYLCFLLCLIEAAGDIITLITLIILIILSIFPLDEYLKLTNQLLQSWIWIVGIQILYLFGIFECLLVLPLNFVDIHSRTKRRNIIRHYFNSLGKLLLCITIILQFLIADTNVKTECCNIGDIIGRCQRKSLSERI
jgi:hypothetical protein